MNFSIENSFKKSPLTFSVQMWLSSASRDVESKNVLAAIFADLATFLRDGSIDDKDKQGAAAALEGDTFKKIPHYTLAGFDLTSPGLPDGMFSNQKSQCG
jgi:hypothetical protein